MRFQGREDEGLFRFLDRPNNGLPSKDAGECQVENQLEMKYGSVEDLAAAIIDCSNVFDLTDVSPLSRSMREDLPLMQ